MRAQHTTARTDPRPIPPPPTRRHPPKRPALGMSPVDRNGTNFAWCRCCGSHWVEFDQVWMAGRPQVVGAYVPVHVDSAGSVDHPEVAPVPPIPVGRHTIALGGRCGECKRRFNVTFGARRGKTVVNVIDVEPVAGEGAEVA